MWPAFPVHHVTVPQSVCHKFFLTSCNNVDIICWSSSLCAFCERRSRWNLLSSILSILSSLCAILISLTVVVVVVLEDLSFDEVSSGINGSHSSEFSTTPYPVMNMWWLFLWLAVEHYVKWWCPVALSHFVRQVELELFVCWNHQVLRIKKSGVPLLSVVGLTM